MIDKDNTTSPLSLEESESTQWASPFEELAGMPSATDDKVDAPDKSQAAPQIIGTPEEDAAQFPGAQSYPDTCAIRCQEFILELYTNQDIPEDQLIEQAMTHGWYTPGEGTPLQDVGNLLELNGIPVNRFEHANIFNLASELGQGHKVIIGIDSGELWGDNPVMEAIQDQFGLDTADHAVVVSGIDTTDPVNPHVLVSDPGTGEALGSYPLAQFLDAWADSNFNMVSTREPGPSYLPEMVNFDYDAGHIPEVTGITWEEFQTFEEQPGVWEDIFKNDLSIDPTNDTPLTVPGTPYSDMNGDRFPDVADMSGDQALIDAGFQAEVDEIEREAFKADLDSRLDPKTFTNPYDD